MFGHRMDNIHWIYMEVDMKVEGACNHNMDCISKVDIMKKKTKTQMLIELKRENKSKYTVYMIWSMAWRRGIMKITIATGKTSQAITPFHFFDYFDFFNFYH